MKKSHSYKVNGHSGSQEISLLLGKEKIPCRAHNKPPLVPYPQPDESTLFP
jgi:hypothetical protein